VLRKRSFRVGGCLESHSNLLAVPKLALLCLISFIRIHRLRFALTSSARSGAARASHGLFEKRSLSSRSANGYYFVFIVPCARRLLVDPDRTNVRKSSTSARGRANHPAAASDSAPEGSFVVADVPRARSGFRSSDPAPAHRRLLPRRRSMPQ